MLAFHRWWWWLRNTRRSPPPRRHPRGHHPPLDLDPDGGHSDLVDLLHLTSRRRRRPYGISVVARPGHHRPPPRRDGGSTMAPSPWWISGGRGLLVETHHIYHVQMVHRIPSSCASHPVHIAPHADGASHMNNASTSDSPMAAKAPSLTRPQQWNLMRGNIVQLF